MLPFCNTAIMLPLYKEFEELTVNEMYSITSLKRHLSDYHLFLIVPRKVNIDEYLFFFQSFNIDVKRFNDNYFVSRKSYNRLCLTTFFYEQFTNFDFLLFFQTDAYIFRNELEQWIKKDFDYIGAPWIIEGTFLQSCQVGNGGFSLRNVKSSIRMLKKINQLKNIYKFFNYFIPLKFLKYLCRILNRPNPQFIFDIFNNRFNEDVVFGIFSSKIDNRFKVAPAETAIAFSFELNPSVAFAINKNELPFGCHAWHIYEPDFWKNFIP